MFHNDSHNYLRITYITRDFTLNFSNVEPSETSLWLYFDRECVLKEFYLIRASTGRNCEKPPLRVIFGRSRVIQTLEEVKNFEGQIFQPDDFSDMA